MMRRSSTRKGGAASVPASNLTSKEFDKIDSLFTQYAERNQPTMIGPDGVEQLCQHLDLDPTDIRILLLAWKLQAARQGYFSLEEWRRGLKTMRVDTIDKLKKTLALLEQEILNPSSFKDFYSFSFQYCLTEPRQKTLDLDTASEMMKLVLRDRRHVSSFILFLKEQTEYKVMNSDQWAGFLRFCDEIDESLRDYDETQAWPLLIDNFVEWARKRT